MAKKKKPAKKKVAAKKKRRASAFKEHHHATLRQFLSESQLIQSIVGQLPPEIKLKSIKFVTAEEEEEKKCDPPGHWVEVVRGGVVTRECSE